jgi:hypothetical protein
MVPELPCNQKLMGKKCNKIGGSETLGTQNSIAPLLKAKA